MSSRRAVLAGLRPLAGGSSNAGLWLDKYLLFQEQKGAVRRPPQEHKDTNSRRDLVAEVAGIGEPERTYGAYFRLWRYSLEKSGAECRKARARGRLIVGLGGEGVIETSVTLHRTYGIPYLPGSALKGVAASFARQQLNKEWGAEGPAYKALFGEMDRAGYVTFYDALYVPKSGHRGRALYPDVLTVHHQEYYQSAPAAPPADWDDPIPVSFISATGDYLVALSGPAELISTAFDILRLALDEAGIGAKTSSGYGRMELEGPPPKPVDPAQKRADELIARVAAMPNSKVANEINTRVAEWRALQADDTQKKRVAQAIVDKVREAGREKASAGKPWYEELLATLR